MELEKRPYLHTRGAGPPAADKMWTGSAAVFNNRTKMIAKTRTAAGRRRRPAAPCGGARGRRCTYLDFGLCWSVAYQSLTITGSTVH